MPHSLRAKIKGLRYKGIITDKDCDRLCKALDNENVLDQIRVEISDFEEEVFQRPNTDYSDYAAVRHCLEIIDRYRNEVSQCT